jgi:hypothetical protein
VFSLLTAIFRTRASKVSRVKKDEHHARINPHSGRGSGLMLENIFGRSESQNLNPAPRDERLAHVFNVSVFKKGQRFASILIQHVASGWYGVEIRFNLLNLCVFTYRF